MLVGCMRDVRISITSKSIGFSLKESTQSNLVGWCLHNMYIVIVVFHTYSWEVLSSQDVYIF